MNHELHAVAGRGEADALRRGCQKGQADAQRDARDRDALFDGGADVRKEADDHADEDDPTEDDLIGRQLVRVPEPRHDCRHGGGDGLLHKGRERGAESGQGGEERQTADAEANCACGHEEQSLATQPLTEGEGPDAQDGDGERQPKDVGAHEADELDPTTRDDRGDAREQSGE